MQYINLIIFIITLSFSCCHFSSIQENGVKSKKDNWNFHDYRSLIIKSEKALIDSSWHIANKHYHEAYDKYGVEMHWYDMYNLLTTDALLYQKLSTDILNSLLEKGITIAFLKNKFIGQYINDDIKLSYRKIINLKKRKEVCERYEKDQDLNQEKRNEIFKENFFWMKKQILDGNTFSSPNEIGVFIRNDKFIYDPIKIMLFHYISHKEIDNDTDMLFQQLVFDNQVHPEKYYDLFLGIPPFGNAAYVVCNDNILEYGYNEKELIKVDSIRSSLGLMEFKLYQKYVQFLIKDQRFIPLPYNRITYVDTSEESCRELIESDFKIYNSKDSLFIKSIFE